MKHLHTNIIASMTEMREPQKVLDKANGKPVAILKNSQLVGYFVPAEAVSTSGADRYATQTEILDSLRRRRDINQPVLDYLKDK